MSDSDPPIPSRKSGGRSFLIVAIVLILAVVGLLLFQASRSEEEEPKAGPSASTPAATPPPVPPRAAPPPPPPPPEPEPEPEAAPEAEPKPKAEAPRNVGCSGECSGDVTQELTRTLTGKARQVRSCYNRALAQNSALSGKLMVAVRVGPRGEVCSARVVSDSLGDASVARCVLQRFRTGSYPRPQGGCVDAQIPINFTPGQ